MSQKTLSVDLNNEEISEAAAVELPDVSLEELYGNSLKGVKPVVSLGLTSDLIGDGSPSSL